jgi:hypothetical protein
MTSAFLNACGVCYNFPRAASGRQPAERTRKP